MSNGFYSLQPVLAQSCINVSLLPQPLPGHTQHPSPVRLMQLGIVQQKAAGLETGHRP